MAPGIGDTINISRKGVEVIDVSGDRVWTKDSAGKVRSYYLTEVAIEVVKKAEKLPENWPPQPNDVWESAAFGVTYHVIGEKAYRNRYGTIGSGVKATDLKDYSDIRLVFRSF